MKSPHSRRNGGVVYAFAGAAVDDIQTVEDIGVNRDKYGHEGEHHTFKLVSWHGILLFRQ